MIYGFVRQSGGQVRIYSEIGRGTTMCFYLPRHSGDAAADKQTAKDGGAGRRAGQTILIVEDEIAIRQLVVDMLGDAGYRVLKAPMGPAGVGMLQSDERIDFLFTAVGLPMRGGSRPNLRSCLSPAVPPTRRLVPAL